jgi:hypothetical protein
MKNWLLLAVALFGAHASRAPILSYVTVGKHRVAFETNGVATSFSAVQEALGGNSIGGDEGSAATGTICYAVIDPTVGATHGMVLAFYAGDDGNGTLTEFELAPEGAKPELNGKCAYLPLTSQDISTNLGIRIGLTRAAVEKKLGRPLREENGKTIYESVDERVVSAADSVATQVEVTSDVDITYRSGRIAAFGGGVTVAAKDSTASQ